MRIQLPFAMSRLIGVCAILSLVACAPEPEGTAPPQAAPSNASDETPHPHDDDEILVLDPPADYLRHLPDLGLEVVEVSDLPALGSRLYHLRVIDGRHPFDARDHHARRFPGVVVDAHHHYEHHADGADKAYTARSAADWAGTAKACGAGLRIGVIDGVIDRKHPAFKNSRVRYRSFHIRGQKLAESAHGTAVASVIAGDGVWAGLLPGAEILHANIFHAGKAGKPVGSAKSILHALDWMIAEKLPVVNMSVGGAPNALIEKAVTHAFDNGMVIIASSGNGGPFSKKKSYPAAYASVIAVTAVDRFQRSARFATSGDYIEFAAPGVDLWTAAPGRKGRAVSGTSFAAPIVTAYAAVALARMSAKSVDGVRAKLRQYVTDRGKPGRDRYTGWGVVQLPATCK